MGQILSLSYSGVQECQKILYVSMFSFMFSCLKVLMHLCFRFFSCFKSYRKQSTFTSRVCSVIHICVPPIVFIWPRSCFHGMRLAHVLQPATISPFTIHAFVRGTNSQSQSRRWCTANRWFRLPCAQQVSGIETSSIAIGSTMLFHSPHAAFVLCWRLSVVAFNDDNPFSCQSLNVTWRCIHIHYIQISSHLQFRSVKESCLLHEPSNSDHLSGFVVPTLSHISKPYCSHPRITSKRFLIMFFIRESRSQFPRATFDTFFQAIVVFLFLLHIIPVQLPQRVHQLKSQPILFIFRSHHTIVNI
jgi:hypothetical protein